jgi:hypothetical protein
LTREIIVAKRGIIGGAADAVKSVAGIALGAAAAAATTAVIESVTKSLAKNTKGLDQALPAIENAVKVRVSKPAQEVADKLLTYERTKTAKKVAAKKRKAGPKKTARKTPAKKTAAKKKKASPRRKR